MRSRLFVSSVLMLPLLTMTACATAGPRSIAIARQGSFAVGGTVVTSPGVFDPTAQAPAGAPPPSAGQTLHGDHAYVFYQVPAHARRLPLVMWHGIGQFSKTWETTPDGREGYQTIFLRRRFSVYVVDQPRRGRAGRSTVDATIRAHLTNRTGSARFALASGPNSFRGCSSRGSRRPSTSTSDRWRRTSGPSTLR